MHLEKKPKVNPLKTVPTNIQKSFIKYFTVLALVIISTLFVFSNLSNDQNALATTTLSNLASPSIASNDCGGSMIWSNGFDNPNWQSSWNISTNQNFGEQNQELIDVNGNKVLRVKYPEGTWSPSDTVSAGLPVGGSQFISTGNGFPLDKACLSYKLKFAPNFDFVKGGKLPGFYAGTENSGGNIPDGTNGLSTRYMWRRLGDGEVYAYLPSSVDSGTSLGRGNWRFVPDRWYNITQEVSLNTPGSSNGYIKVWLDGNLVLNQQNIVFRTVESLKIEGVFFSTFFGGDDVTWATPNDTYTEYDDFQVFGYNGVAASSQPSSQANSQVSTQNSSQSVNSTQASNASLASSISSTAQSLNSTQSSSASVSNSQSSSISSSTSSIASSQVSSNSSSTIVQSSSAQISQVNSKAASTSKSSSNSVATPNTNQPNESTQAQSSQSNSLIQTTNLEKPTLKLNSGITLDFNQLKFKNGELASNHEVLVVIKTPANKVIKIYAKTDANGNISIALKPPKVSLFNQSIQAEASDYVILEGNLSDINNVEGDYSAEVYDYNENNISLSSNPILWRVASDPFLLRTGAGVIGVFTYGLAGAVFLWWLKARKPNLNFNSEDL